VIIQKKVGHRYLEKRVNLRIEHVSPSRSRDDFLRRVKANASAKKAARANGTTVQIKRQPALPRGASTVSLTGNLPETVTPIAYETTI
jgi:large subunit ribosomal protein L21e